MKRLQAVKLCVLTLAAVNTFMVAMALAQDVAGSLPINVTGEDRIAAATVTSSRFHLLLTKQAKAAGVSAESSNVKFKSRIHAAVPKTTLPSPPANTFFYPDDVEKVSTTGATIAHTANHPIYVNCASPNTPTTCFGGPGTFLTNLDASSMLHLADQYTGSTTNGRYTVGSSFSYSETIYPGTSGTPTLGENDILTLVHSAAKTGGTGYANIYHVFLPNGVDTCMDAGPCYSPDNVNSFAFCGYHYTVKFPDLASPVYYTVIPYQGAWAAPANNLCTLPAGTVNGPLVDSMATVVTHELFETITDPDITTGYRAVNSNFGEVGDVCEGIIFNGIGMNGHNYAVQAIYSDKYEACATTP